MNDNTQEPFETLERDLGLTALKELLDLFKNTFPAKIEKISKSIEAKNFEPVYFETHQMVSSAANMGANEVSNLVRDLETVLKASDTKQALDVLTKIRTEFASYISRADNYLSSGSHRPPELGI